MKRSHKPFYNPLLLIFLLNSCLFSYAQTANALNKENNGIEKNYAINNAVKNAINEINVAPKINRYYKANPDFENWLSIFESEGREVYDLREHIVEKLNIQPGQSIADIGAGTGLFSLLFAHKVGPEGKIFAVDIAEEFVRNIAIRAQKEGLNNIETILNTPKSVNLTPQSVDMAYVCDTYHHFEYPLTTLKDIHQALKKQGYLVIVDYRKQKNFSSAWIMNHVRATKEAVIKEVESQGFKLVEDTIMLGTKYFLKFQKI